MANKSVLTQEDFLDFYNSHIKPFLGYSFTNIANQFDKANLYSTTEKIVGTWIDGKPLYQKVINLQTGVKIGDVSGAWTGLAGVTIPNGENLVNIVCKQDNTHRQPPVLFKFNSSTGNLEYWTTTVLANKDYYVIKQFILQYTKTTDSAIAIGSDTDYSTTEKIVGTWIDGKPVYQRTVATTIAITGQESDWTNVTDVIDTNIEKIVYSEVLRNGTQSVPWYMVAIYQGKLRVQPCLYPNPMKSSSWCNLAVGSLITIQYTKTTDTASN